MPLKPLLHINLVNLIFGTDRCILDNETIAGHLLNYRLDQDAAIGLLFGPGALQDTMLASLRTLIQEECRRSTTFATAFEGHVVMPGRRPALFDVVGISKQYKLYIPVRKTILTLVIRRGHLRNRSELELRLYHHSSSSLDPEESGIECPKDGRHLSHGFPRPECSDLECEVDEHYWSSAREWLRARYGEKQPKQHVPTEPFRFPDLPAELRLMVYEYVAGKQIWPWYRNSGWTYSAQRERFPTSLRERPRIPGQQYDYVYDDEQREKRNLAILLRKTWFNSISTGLYPMTFAKFQKWCWETDTSWSGLPEDTHFGLGPTKAEEASARNLLRVNRQIRKEYATVVWGKSIKRFNDLDDFDDTVRYLRTFCTQLDLLGHVFEPRDPLVLSRISLSFINEDYLTFVGYKWTGDSIRKAKSSWLPIGGLELLSHIHTLQHLNLQFQLLRRHYFLGDYEITEYDPWIHDDQDGRGFCQKEFVDIILTLGYELLRGIKKVTVSGHVGKSNHEKWEPLFRDQLPPWNSALRRHWPLGKPRERRDMTADVARILAMSDEELPPICRCSEPCQWWWSEHREQNGEWDMNW